MLFLSHTQLLAAEQPENPSHTHTCDAFTLLPQLSAAACWPWIQASGLSLLGDLFAPRKPLASATWLWSGKQAPTLPSPACRPRTAAPPPYHLCPGLAGSSPVVWRLRGGRCGGPAGLRCWGGRAPALPHSPKTQPQPQATGGPAPGPHSSGCPCCWGGRAASACSVAPSRASGLFLRKGRGQ